MVGGNSDEEKGATGPEQGSGRDTDVEEGDTKSTVPITTEKKQAGMDTKRDIDTTRDSKKEGAHVLAEHR